jgi:hypothetical protein
VPVQRLARSPADGVRPTPGLPRGADGELPRGGYPRFREDDEEGGCLVCPRCDELQDKSASRRRGMVLMASGATWDPESWAYGETSTP